MFEKFGPIETLVAKRNRNSEYCFAFVEMKDHQAAADCVREYLEEETDMIRVP